MNIKVKENAGSFEQSFAKMLDKIYGNNGNVKVEVKKTHDGTLYTVLNDFDQVDFLFKTDKGTKAPTCDITIGGDTLFTKTGDPKKKVKTYYGLFDEDPTILRSFQQILQKYIDGVDLDLPWLRFEESKESEAKRNYYGYGKDDKGKKPEESAKPVKNILRRRFEVLTKSVLHACDKLVKDASLAGEFDDEVIYAEDAVKNAVESFNAMGDAIVRLKTVLESHKNEDNMEIIGILSDAITKIVADEQGDETDAATAGADSVIDQVEREYGNEPENEPEANGEENEAPSPAGAEAPDEF